MKIILSKKGFDSHNGKQPSPIMPDGTLLSLPIPDEKDKYNTFGSLHYGGNSYFDIISSLKPRTALTADTPCHLDPDIREDVKEREKWEPAFGQCDSALGILRNNHVSVGDIFLFFGLFRETEMHNGKLRYKLHTRPKHIIYGYMQIGKIIDNENEVPIWLKQHPHYSYKKSWEKGKNIIYLPTEHLSFNDQFPGCTTLDFRKDRVLTKDGMKSYTCWDLPKCFKQVDITYHKPSAWQDDYFQSLQGIGQEFIMDATPEILEWVKQIITD